MEAASLNLRTPSSQLRHVPGASAQPRHLLHPAHVGDDGVDVLGTQIVHRRHRSQPVVVWLNALPDGSLEGEVPVHLRLKRMQHRRPLIAPLSDRTVAGGARSRVEVSAVLMLRRDRACADPGRCLAHGYAIVRGAGD